MFRTKLKQSVISPRKDGRRGALTEKMGLMLKKSLCLMFEVFENRKKKMLLTGVCPSVLYLATSDGLMRLTRQTAMSGVYQKASSVFCEGTPFPLVFCPAQSFLGFFPVWFSLEPRQSWRNLSLQLTVVFQLFG